MFTVHSRLEVQPESIYKSQRQQFTIRSAGTLIGMVEETVESASSWKDQLLQLVSLHFLSSKNFCVTKAKAEPLAAFRKKRGLNQKVDLFDQHGNWMAVVEQKLKFSSQRLSVRDTAGRLLLTAEGRNGSLVFVVYAEGDPALKLSTIKKRSIPYPTTKEALTSMDHYEIANDSALSEFQQLLILMIPVIVFDQLHNA
ncbi:hypothetical protein [Halobacillus litoralis]|uniref:hypothetical protein n=1 Tax=Halobacillus litoralis TaxID=45668 RepID=UPI001CD258D9|nr:hypothetical protein [Halobacillus litoralis]MCA1023582.1 hypothetical protein [Halobacillus litoralis]